MSVVTKFSDLDLSKTYTYADYLTWQFSERVELIKGFIKKMSPAPNRKHQTLISNLHLLLHKKYNFKNCQVFLSPFDVRLPILSKKKNTTVVQPDICIICDESKLDEQGCNGAPDLIIEIISKSNSKHDVDTKFRLYEEASVPEYWIVYPDQEILNQYFLIDGKYIGNKPFARGENIACRIFENLIISIDDIFENV